jgi:mRNA-degrading endonuclease toxin of MazEF toxin-antitoxin module
MTAAADVWWSGEKCGSDDADETRTVCLRPLFAMTHTSQFTVVPLTQNFSATIPTTHAVSEAMHSL